MSSDISLIVYVHSPSNVFQTTLLSYLDFYSDQDEVDPEGLFFSLQELPKFGYSKVLSETEVILNFTENAFEASENIGLLTAHFDCKVVSLEHGDVILFVAHHSNGKQELVYSPDPEYDFSLSASHVRELESLGSLEEKLLYIGRLNFD